VTFQILSSGVNIESPVAGALSLHSDLLVFESACFQEMTIRLFTLLEQAAFSLRFPLSGYSTVGGGGCYLLGVRSEDVLYSNDLQTTGEGEGEEWH
jgi:hypothetical protein